MKVKDVAAFRFIVNYGRNLSKEQNAIVIFFCPSSTISLEEHFEYFMWWNRKLIRKAERRNKVQHLKSIRLITKHNEGNKSYLHGNAKSARLIKTTGEIY